MPTPSSSWNSRGVATTSYVAGGRLAHRVSNDANGLEISRVQPGNNAPSTTSASARRGVMSVHRGIGCGIVATRAYARRAGSQAV